MQLHPTLRFFLFRACFLGIGSTPNRRDPDLIIRRTPGTDADPHLLRWHLIPRNPIFNIYLHEFVGSDASGALHSHPWLFNISILVNGKYLEHRGEGKKPMVCRDGDVIFRWGKSFHRIELFDKPWGFGAAKFEPARVRSIFITGPRIRDWGFLKDGNFTPWKDFVRLFPGRPEVKA